MLRARRAAGSILLSLALLLVPALARAGIDFRGIGDLPGGAVASAALGVSADGRVVVGRSETSVEDASGAPRVGDEAVRWRATTGIQGLGFGAPPFPFPGGINEALAASADGSVIVGASNFDAFRWTQETGLVATVSGGPGFALSFAVSADGTLEAGGADRGIFLSPYLVRRAPGEVPEVVFPEIDGSFTIGAFYDVSADASVAVGTAETISLPRAPVRWTEAGGFEFLGALPGGETGTATAVSADGSVIFGGAFSPRGQEAFRWTAETGLVGLGDLGAPDPFASSVLDATADGSVEVGRSSAGAFIWDAELGMRELEAVLVAEFGLDLDGWSLEEATGISADGRVIVGNGVNPGGRPEGWVATVPEPATALLLAAGLLPLCRHRRSRG